MSHAVPDYPPDKISLASKRGNNTRRSISKMTAQAGTQTTRTGRTPVDSLDRSVGAIERRQRLSQPTLSLDRDRAKELRIRPHQT
jgi:hypothetical protein